MPRTCTQIQSFTLVQEAGPSTATLAELNVSTLLASLPKGQSTRKLLSSTHRRKVSVQESTLYCPFATTAAANKAIANKFTVRLASKLARCEPF